jgi:hypothetical protein
LIAALATTWAAITWHAELRSELFFLNQDTVRLGLEQDGIALMIVQVILLLGVLGTFVNKSVELQREFLSGSLDHKARIALENWVAYRVAILAVMFWAASSFLWMADPWPTTANPYAGLFRSFGVTCVLVCMLVAISTFRTWQAWIMLPHKPSKRTVGDLIAPLTRAWMGMDTTAFIRALRAGRGGIDVARMVSFTLTAAWAVANSVGGPIDRHITRRRIRSARRRMASLTDLPPGDGIASAPIFILGHWGSGTTLLHEILALHPELTAPTCFECWAPHASALFSECTAERWLPMVVPRWRPMDAVELSFSSPQEDEFAMMNLGHRSPYLRFQFPRSLARAPLAGLLDLGPSEGPWIRDLRRFVETVSARRAVGHPSHRTREQFQRTGRLPRVVLKSPAHTARPELLLRAFPDASFVFVHRDPESILSSTIATWSKVGNDQGFQAAMPTARVTDTNLEDFRLLWQSCVDVWFQDNFMSRVHLIAYKDIDPTTRAVEPIVETLHSLLERLGVKGGIGADAHAFLEAKKVYPKNQHPKLHWDNPENAKKVLEGYCAAFGYREPKFN